MLEPREFPTSESSKDPRVNYLLSGQTQAPIVAEYFQRPGGEESAKGIGTYWKTLYRNKGKLILFAAIGAGLGYLAVLPQTPVYRASTSLEVLEVNNSFLNLKSLDPTSHDSSLETRIHTEMKMLQSQSLVRQVNEKVMASNSPLVINETDPVTDLLLKIGLPALRSNPSRLEAVRMAATSLQIRNQDQTRILEVTCESTDPKTASEFANQLIQTYMDSTVEGRLDNAQRTREWLDRQIDEIRQKLESSSTQLVAYAQSAGLTLGKESSEKLGKLQDRLAEAQAQSLQRGVDYNSAKTGNLSLLPEVQQDQELKALKAELSKSVTELDELSAVLAPGHYRIIRLRTQQEQLKKRIELSEQRILQRLESEYLKAKSMEKAYVKAYEDQQLLVSAQDRKMIRHNMLQREVETYRQLYDTMLQRVKEATIASALRASSVRVVDKAEVPKKAYKPQPARNVLTGLATGLFLGIVLVIVRTSSDRRFRSPGEASAYLNIRELGTIPTASSLDRPVRKRWLPQRGSSDLEPYSKQAILEPGRSQELSKWMRSASPQTESFRSVLVSLMAGKGNKTSFVVTSPNPGDGKTSVVSNLGIALTEVGRRVLLIDADLRRPRLHKVFNIPNNWGLTDLVECETPWNRTFISGLTQPKDFPNLYILPSGTQAQNIVKVLHCARMREVLSLLQAEFDVILIDTPPMMPSPDARILAQSTDGAVLVLRAGVTDLEVGRRTAERLKEDGITIFGAILNDWNPKDISESEGKYGSRPYSMS